MYKGKVEQRVLDVAGLQRHALLLHLPVHPAKCEIRT